MKVSELIAALSSPKVNPEAEVLVWVGDERHALHPDLPVDMWDDKGRWLDLNVVTTEGEKNEAK